MLPSTDRTRPGLALLAALCLLAACQPAAGGKPDTRLAKAGPVEPGTAAGAYLAGQFAQKHYNWDDAARFLSSAMAMGANGENLERQTLILELGAGRMGEALALAHKLADSDSDFTMAPILLALEDIHEGRLDEAAPRLEPLIGDGLHRFLTPLLRAWALEGLGETDQAVAQLQEFIDSPGVGPIYRLHAGLIAAHAGKDDAATAEMEQLAEAELTDRTASVLGAFHESRGQADAARAVYEKLGQAGAGSTVAEAALLRLDSGAPADPLPGPADGAAQAMSDLAALLQRENVTDMALIYARLSLWLQPRQPFAQLLLGDILIERERPEEAVAAYRAIPRGNPLSWPARLRASYALEQNGKLEESLAMLRQMATDRTDRRDALAYLGDALRRHERFAEAAGAYSRSIALTPDPGPEDWLVFYSRGICYERIKQWPKAEADFLKALELSPEQPYVLNYLGYSWADQNLNLDRALDMLRRAVELRPQDGYIIDSLGWALYRIGKYDEAVVELERAVEFEAGDSTVNDHLGDAYWRAGRYKEARFQWERALKTADDEKKAAEISAKLQRGLTADNR